MLTLLYQGDLGFRLSQRAFAIVLATRLGYPIVSHGNSFGFSWPAFNRKEVWSGNWPYDMACGRFLTENEIRKPPRIPITLSGLFQRFELISEHRENIRNDWLRLPLNARNRCAGDFVICLSSGQKDWRSPFTGVTEPISDLETVERLCARATYKRLYIVHDGGINLQGFSHLSAIPVTFSSEWDELLFISCFQKAAISQNTLQWWAVFLGAAREIYFPSCRDGAWSHPERATNSNEPAWWGIDHRVDQEDRWIYDWNH